MKPVVIDASVTLAGYLRDEESAAARNFFRNLDAWEVHAPAIWPLEVANGLLVASRRNRLSFEAAEGILGGLATYVFHIDRQADLHASRRLLSLARSYELTVYDAAYLELALRRSADLATLDSKLSRAAEMAGLALTIAR